MNAPSFCSETQNRIRLLLAAWAYEYAKPEFMSDSEFDALCLEIDLNAVTSRPDLDMWFTDNFNAYTGSWVRNFPELKELESLYWRLLYSRQELPWCDFMRNNNLEFKT